MKRVSKEEFYSTVGQLNVHPYPTGDYPYTSFFKTPSGEIRGKVVGVIPEGKALPEHEYYISHYLVQRKPLHPNRQSRLQITANVR